MPERTWITQICSNDYNNVQAMNIALATMREYAANKIRYFLMRKA